MRPNLSTVLVRAACTSSLRVTSQLTARAWPPRFSIMRAVSCLLWLVDVGDHDVGAFAGERQCGGAADATGSAGHKRDLAGEASVRVGHVCSLLLASQGLVAGLGAPLLVGFGCRWCDGAVRHRSAGSKKGRSPRMRSYHQIRLNTVMIPVAVGGVHRHLSHLQGLQAHFAGARS